MKKSNLTLFIFIVLGLLAGSIVAQLLLPVQGISFLTKSTLLVWHPKADLQFIKYDLDFQVKLNLISVLGVIAAIWLYRRMN